MKYYPHIDIKCNGCSNEIRIPLQYESDRDRFTRAADGQRNMVYFPKNYQQWDLSDGIEGRDHCPLCRVTETVCETENEVRELPE